MNLTIFFPSKLLEAVYIPDCLKKLNNLKNLLNNRGTRKECFYLLEYAYTRSVYERQIRLTPQAEIIFPLFNKGKPLLAKCTPHHGDTDKPNQKFKLSSFLYAESFTQRKDKTPQIIERFSSLDTLSMELGSFHTLCEHNRTQIMGDNYQSRTEILTECVKRSIRYAQAIPSVIQVDYYHGHQQLEIPYLDQKSRIQSNLMLVLRLENGKWIMPTVLPRKYLESNKKLRLN